MSCLSCHAELPVGAMFCGECGRATSSRGLAPVRPAATPAPEIRATASTDARATPELAPGAGDTIALDRNWLSAEFDLYPTPAPEVILEEPEPQPEPEPEPEIVIELEPELEPEAEPEFEFESEPAPEPERAPAPVPESVWSAPATVPATPVVSSSASEPIAEDPDEESDDNELTRIVSRRGLGERFVLQFSTGDSTTVFGSGLLGRNPIPQPGEAFDQLVVLSDPGKSVSKTHLEFGQENGTFWLSDRFSANGTVIREPEAAPRRCEPGKRYRVVRGTRIDLGEQFVVVS